jgi:DNA polymerase-3 subunit gamma/tau
MATGANADVAMTEFLADEVQLYYQIALVGLRDLPFAPDQRSGFEMTLLRMLTFTPERDGSAGVPPRGVTSKPSGSASDVPPDAGVAEVAGDKADSAAGSTSESAANNVARQGSAEPIIELMPIPEPVIAAPEASPGAGSDKLAATGSIAERWYAVVAELTIGGVAKMIAEHSVPLVFTDTQIELQLSVDHDTLLSDAQVMNLQRSLQSILGATLEITVKVGEPVEETPAQRRARLLAERQAEAETAMREDATVQALLADFDGKLEEVRLH